MKIIPSLLVLTGLWASACGPSLKGQYGSSGFVATPLHPFTTNSDLQQAAQRAASHSPVDLAAIEPVSEWPLSLAHGSLEGPASASLRRAIAAAGAAIEPSDAMQCVANELARLTLHLRKGQPEEQIRRFIAGRCGAVAATPGYRVWEKEFPVEMTDEQVVAAEYGTLQRKLSEILGASAPDAVGFDIAREGSKVSFILATERPAVKVEPFDRIVSADGLLRVRGQVRFETDLLEGYVTAGRYGFRACQFNQAAIAPAFEMTCQVAPGDQSAWVQLLARPRGRVLPEEVLQVLTLRDPEAERVYRHERFGKSMPVASDVEFRNAVVLLVNEVRRAAKLPAISLSEPQSRAVSSAVLPLVSKYEHKTQEIDTLVNEITLGLVAGWQVQGGVVQGARLTASMPILSQADATEWLAQAFVRPYNRVVLLAPEAQVIAIGATFHKAPEAIGAVAISYRLFDEEARRAVEDQVRARLVELRHARGLGDTTFIDSMEQLDETLRRIREENLEPTDSLWSLVQSTARFTQLPAHGFLWKTYDVDAIEFPLQVLQPGRLILTIGVTHFRPQGAAWGQYAAFFVIVKAPRAWSKLISS